MRAATHKEGEGRYADERSQKTKHCPEAQDRAPIQEAPHDKRADSNLGGKQGQKGSGGDAYDDTLI